MKKVSARRVVKKVSLPSAATLLVVTMLLAQLLGFLRTMLINGKYGITGSESTDAYFAAFKIPDFFFYILAAGVLSVAFIPILTEHLKKHDRKGVWELVSSLMNLMGIVTFVIGIVIFIFADQFINIVAPDLTPAQFADAVTIMRLVAFNPFFFTISGILTSAQQIFGRFFFFAISPVVYNMCIIASIYIFEDSIGLRGIGIGALAGGVAQMLASFVGVKGLHFKYSWHINFKNTDFRRILKQLPARSVDQGIDSVNSIVETNRAARLGQGVISNYENAFILHTAPILLIGSSISTAAFPRLSERLASNRIDLFRKDFNDVLRTLMWLTAPVVVIAFFCRGYLARLIFKDGSVEIATLLGLLSIAIFFRVLYTLFSRYFYAHKDTTTPLIISVFAIALNIILVFTLARPEAYGYVGLALAQAITSAVELVVIGIVMVLRDRKIITMEFWNMSFKLLSATGFTIVTAFVMVSILPLLSTDRGFITLGGKLSLIALVTFSVHIVVTAFYDFYEAKITLSKIKQFMYKPFLLYTKQGE